MTSGRFMRAKAEDDQRDDDRADGGADQHLAAIHGVGQAAKRELDERAAEDGAAHQEGDAGDRQADPLGIDGAERTEGAVGEADQNAADGSNRRVGVEPLQSRAWLSSAAADARPSRGPSAGWRGNRRWRRGRNRSDRSAGRAPGGAGRRSRRRSSPSDRSKRSCRGSRGSSARSARIRRSWQRRRSRSRRGRAARSRPSGEMIRRLRRITTADTEPIAP